MLHLFRTQTQTMKVTNPAFNANMPCNYIEDISEYLKSPVKNNTIQVPESFGTGFITNLFLEKGFFVRYFHFTPKQDFVFKWASEPADSESIFKLITYLEDINNTEVVTSNKNTHAYETENSTILYSTEFLRSGVIPKGTLVNRMIFFFTKSWLEENFSEASERIFEIVCELVKKHKPTFISEKMNKSQLLLAHELAAELNKDNFPLIHIKTKGLMMLNSFLDKLVSENPGDVIVNQTLYYTQIKKIASRLNDYLDKPMPNIEELAAEFNLSKGTLQRHFKIVYGKAIYTYYLEKKLALGKALIIAKEKTISEIAYSLGYNKINSFSKAFKKHYGILPKDLNYRQAS